MSKSLLDIGAGAGDDAGDRDPEKPAAAESAEQRSLREPLQQALAAATAEQQADKKDAEPDQANTAEAESNPAASKPKTAINAQQRNSMRSKARRVALQALYQWQLTNHSLLEMLEQFAEDPALAKADDEYFRELVAKIIADAEHYDELINQFSDRNISDLDPIEHAVLLIGCYEMDKRPDLPFKVVISENVKMAKEFGGAESHNFINGVLDKVAAKLRHAEYGS